MSVGGSWLAIVAKNRQRGRQSDREAGRQSIGNYVNQTYDNVNNDVEIWPILF